MLAVAKISAGLLGNSYVLIADGIESALDIAGSAVIWGGLKFAARPPDAGHPYGHGKAEPMAAGIVAAGVIIAAIALAIQSVREIFTPHHAPAPFTLIVLIIVIIVKEFLFRSVIRLGKDVASTAVQTDAWHHRSDALTSAAAFIGISIALIGGAGWESARWAALSPAPSSRPTAIAPFPAYEIWTARAEIVAMPGAALGAGVLEGESLVRKMGLSFYATCTLGEGGISVRDGTHGTREGRDQQPIRNADVWSTWNGIP